MYAADWETCVISLSVVKARLLRRWDWRLTAAVLAPSGRTTIGQSPIFKARTKVTRWNLNRVAGTVPTRSTELAKALESLTERLQHDGWELMTGEPSESVWFLRSFRRRAMRSAALLLTQ